MTNLNSSYDGSGNGLLVMKLQLKFIAKILDSKSNNSILFTVPQTKALALATVPHKQQRKAAHPRQVLPPQPQQKTSEKAPKLGRKMAFYGD